MASGDGLRVLLAHNHFGVTGGAEVFVHEMARLIRVDGGAAEVFAPLDDGVPVDHPLRDLLPAPLEHLGGSLPARAARFPKMLWSRATYRAMRLCIERFKPDVVHAFAIYLRLTPSLIDACADAGVPVVVSNNDYKLICPNYKLFHHGQLCGDCRTGRYWHAVRNRCVKDSTVYSVAAAVEAYWQGQRGVYLDRVAHHTFASEFMRRTAQDWLGNALPPSSIVRNPYRRVAGGTTTGRGDEVLFVGRLIEEKGADRLIRAAQALPRLRFRIIGDGPDRQALERLAAQLGVHNLVFDGAVWGEALSRALASARMLVVPSLWHENFPYVIFQAFDAGLPVLGSRRGGIPELLGEGGARGGLFDPDSHDGMVAVISAWHGDHALRERAADAAAAYLESEFSDQRVGAALSVVYEQALGRGGRG
jgi:glycosyltransferase involved in cell wall biosynthesis